MSLCHVSIQMEAVVFWLGVCGNGDGSGERAGGGEVQKTPQRLVL